MDNNNDGSYTYLHPAIDHYLCSPIILMDTEFKVESDSYGSDHFPIIKKLVFHFLMHDYPTGTLTQTLT